MLSVQTNTLTDKGDYILRLIVTDEFTILSSTFHFTVKVFNNPCTKGLNNIPADNQYDTLYTLGSGAFDISFSGIDNTECPFVLELYNDASLTIPVDPSDASDPIAPALSVVAATFT